MPDNFEDLIDTKSMLGVESATEEVSPEVDAQHTAALEAMVDFVHGPAAEKLVDTMASAPELWRGVGDVATDVVTGVKRQLDSQRQEVDPTIFFAEDGLLHNSIDLLFELAQEAGLPGSEDEDQYGASLMWLMKNVGESIVKDNDELAVEEAENLFIDMIAGEEGVAPQEAGPVNPVAAGVNQGLLQ